MWTTFLISLKVSLRNRTALFWMLLFPIVLATMFNGMLGGLSDGYETRPVPMVVVADANWNKAPVTRAFVDALAGKASDSEAIVETTGTTGATGQTLLTVTEADSPEDARKLLADGTAKGYLTADDGGRLAITLSRAAVSAIAAGSTSDPGLGVSVAALNTVTDLYNRADAVARRTLADNPQAALSRSFWNAVGSAGTPMTREVSLTNAKPDATARYFYALLAMNCLMAMSYAVGAVNATQANLSALGIRRTVAPLRRSSQLLAGFLACWLCSFAALLIALAYIRYVCGVGIGGHEPQAVLAVAVASFMANSAGTLLGAIPKLSADAKTALTSAISCALSLFTGLYGGFAMQLSDWIARNAPALGLINPAQQVVNLFYSLMYYDGYGPFVRTCVTLLAMSALFLAGGVALLRRQRYEHL
ncbi:ABC transporter permease [Bifidobacterium avesanii]|uniref:ABC transporter permease n=1 Tax=Bifidobacterium avesanii TaxID=1798157 RepID=A0A7K3TFP2_9BIFI|nr:ABC transporter permease [Bifidobacterium avesanii]KAB8295454.1 multidrug ABC transporter permease [Bifidobacterium avesanii]NEG77460.1 ABC transporter permease [Bifidobacterium avesanii]